MVAAAAHRTAMQHIIMFSMQLNRKEKRKSYTFQHQFKDKLNIMLGCPGIKFVPVQGPLPFVKCKNHAEEIQKRYTCA